MLAWLRKEQEGRNARELHEHWHQTMERLEGREQRKAFFSEVIRLTESVRRRSYIFRFETERILTEEKSSYTDPAKSSLKSPSDEGRGCPSKF
jgi:hypothetical protein